MTSTHEFTRFQSAVPNRLGTFPGVFALVNGLGREGSLDTADEAWRRRMNDGITALYLDPTTVDPTCYDRQINPGARAWFRCTATHLLDLTAEYLTVLDRYSVPWVELSTRSPGTVVYADDVQVVAVPYRHPDDWPLRERTPVPV
ncbi:hypothetical protein ABLG96_16120 [Nakamurella sp. A5-74]|uniref:Uncharacterized protein n=1 Tax=Nakamurella sp. A5-74 TaxID=3158264 RepID=A0AAU8DPC7_9ACTN